MIPDPRLAIPSGANTYSKASDRYPPNAPRQAIAAHGAYVETEKGYYIDCTSALGPILLGHGNAAVMRAAHRQMLAGASFSLPTKIELELSHRLINMTPGMEMCRFGKNGNDVVNAAVRIARAATGRPSVLRNAYHGHADWAIEEPMAGGVSPAYRDLTHRIIPGDLNDLERHLRWPEAACVVLEPYPSHDPVNPGPEYFQEARKLCDEHGTLLILDEMVTGFRCGWPGAVEHMGIEPDLWCGAKALGGGFPLTALLGRAKYMRLIETDVFYSTTFAGEAVSIAAAMACLGEMERVGAYAEVEDIGNRIATRYVIQAVHHGLGDYTRVKGYPSRPVFHWNRPDMRAAFLEAVTDHGLLFQGYINITVSHREVLDKITEALTAGLKAAQALLTDKPEVSCA